jgi:hypothetical protein
MKYKFIKLSSQTKDITGLKFSMLTVVGPIGRTNDKKISWLCLCECRNHTKTTNYKLTSGHTKSCGCYKAIATKKSKTTHGKRSTEEYSIWAGIKNRCLNNNEAAYKRYGARGITICDEWKNDFMAFYDDMGKRPSKEHSIDRINNNEGYYKENCRWATPLQQGANTRQNKYITFNGETKILSQWARDLGIAQSTLSKRLNQLNWPLERALTEAVNY